MKFAVCGAGGSASIWSSGVPVRGRAAQKFEILRRGLEYCKGILQQRGRAAQRWPALC